MKTSKHLSLFLRPYFMYFLLVVLNILVVWLINYFPTQDGPSHVYNLAILNDLLNGGHIWGKYYTYNLRAVPNLGFLAISYPFIYVFNPYIVEKIFISIYILLMSVSVPVFIRTFAPSNLPLSFVIFPLIFNFCFMMGFYSFSIAVPCMLLAIASAWAIRDWTPLFKLIALNIIGIALFYLHLIPFVIYVISIVTMSAIRSRNLFKIAKESAIATLTISPMVFILINYIYSIKSATPYSPSYSFSLPSLFNLTIELLTFSSYSLSPWQMLPCALLLLVLYPAIKSRVIFSKGKEKLTPEQLFIIMLTISITLLYFFMPFGLGGGSYFNQRLIVIIFVFIVPLLKIPSVGFYQKYCPYLLGSVALISIVTNVAVFRSQTIVIREFLSGLEADIPRGSIIATYKPMGSDRTPVEPLLHASSYYALRCKCVDAGNYEAALPYFQVRFKDTVPPLPDTSLLENAPDKIEWKQFPSIKYLLGWKIGNYEIKRLEVDFNKSFETKNFILWERRQDNI